MPIVNIIDGRRHEYRFKTINAIVEAAWHDNGCEDADQVLANGEPGPGYAQREHVSLQAAIKWAQTFAAPVTLYLYDKDGGIYVYKTKKVAA